MDADAATVVQKTEPDRVMGTPDYMSPEQVWGEPADHCADIFAFGCVLYEMLTGARAFRRNTPVESMNAVLNEQPPEISTTHPNVPLALALIVERCLEKQPDNRFQSAKDLAFALGEISSPRPEALNTRDVAKPQWRRTVIAASAVLLTALTAWLSFSARSGLNSPTNGSKAASGLPAGQQKSVAVLPFVNMSADKADEYLSDGISEEIITALSKIKGLKVSARTSSFAFKGRNEDIRKIGQQLRVGTVLEGSISKVGNKLRVTVKLISIAEGFHLWSETYDRALDDLLAIRTDVAAHVAEALKGQLLGEERQQLTKRTTASAEAHRLYLQGRYLWNRRTGESLKQAIEIFNQAIAKDSSYALAYAGMADCYVVLPSYAHFPQRDSAPRARAAALKALEMDSGLVEPHATLAYIKHSFDWDWVGSEAEFRWAIKLNPNYPTAHHWLSAAVLTTLGRYDEALAEIKQAQEIDPLSPIINATLGEKLSMTGRDDLAIDVLRNQIAIDPSFLLARRILGRIYLSQAKLPEALSELETMHRLDRNGTYGLESLGFVYAHAGRANDAQKVLVQMLEGQRQGLDYRLGIALVEHALGDGGRALDSLDTAFEERAFGLERLSYDPFWKDLRPHPRVQAILKRMNLVK